MLLTWQLAMHRLVMTDTQLQGMYLLNMTLIMSFLSQEGHKRCLQLGNNYTHMQEYDLSTLGPVWIICKTMQYAISHLLIQFNRLQYFREKK